MAFNLFGKRDKETPDQPTQQSEQPPQKLGLFDRMKQAVTRTRDSFTESIASVVALTREVDEATLISLEPILLSADLGAPTTALILENLRQRALRTGIEGGPELKRLLKLELKAVLDNVTKPITNPSTPPEVIMMVGVNGTGKTTTTGKLANLFATGHHRAPSSSAQPTPSAPPPSSSSKSGPPAPTPPSSKPSKVATPQPPSTTPAPPPKPAEPRSSSSTPPAASTPSPTS